jgi:uroporphyrinogen-III decarboxylase
VPDEVDNWHWLVTTSKDPQRQAREIADAVHQLSEKLAFRPISNNSPWVIAAYILAGLFILEIILIAVAALANILLN